MEINIPKIPKELKNSPLWILWKSKPKGNGKTTKIPYSVTGGMAKSDASSTWTSLENDLKRYKAGGYNGIGYVFSKDDPFCGIDLDHCRDAKTSEIESWALEIIRDFHSYCEISPSGTGVHIICKGKLPEGGRKKGNIEIYDRLRYFTVTGNRLDGTPTDIKPAQDAINKLLASHFKKEVSPQEKKTSSSLRPNLDDAELIEKAIESANGHKFDLLYQGRWQETGYPSQSEADQAFCNLLAFWTGKDPARIDSIFRQSGLMRPKWDQKHYGDGRTYGQVTIIRAMSTCVETYSQEKYGETIPKNSGEDGKKEKKTQSQILCEIAEDIETFCTSDGDVYAFIPVNGHLECWPVRWKIFKQWLVKGFFDRFAKPPGGQALQDALNVIEAKAQFSGQERREVFLRVAEYGGKVYLDLCNETWQVVEIGADGWQVIDTSPVPFKRPPGLLPLPLPSKKGDKANFQALKKYINLRSKNDFILLVAWLVGALRMQGDHVILVLQGPEGTGKTTAARLIKSIIDPNVSSERSSPRNEEDFIIGASNNHITSFDNISSIQPWLSDALCRLSTGGGLSTRRLYTNDEEKLFYARRPAILTGINPMPNRNDLARRCIVLNLEPIQGQVLEEKSLLKKFKKEALPGILGAVCDAVSAALRNEKMETENLPCMASFTAWVLRAEEALPWEAGDFRKAYQENTQNIIEMAVDADLISSAIQNFMTGKESWEGIASELLDELCEIVPEKTQKQKAWPKLPNVLSNKLKKASNFLRQVGIRVETGIKTTKGKRLIVLGQGTKKTATIATSPPDEDNSLKTQEKMGGDKGGDSGDGTEKTATHQVPEIIKENRLGGDSGDSGGKIPTQSTDDFETELPPESEQEVIGLW